MYFSGCTKGHVQFRSLRCYVADVRMSEAGVLCEYPHEQVCKCLPLKDQRKLQDSAPVDYPKLLGMSKTPSKWFSKFESSNRENQKTLETLYR